MIATRIGKIVFGQHGKPGNGLRGHTGAILLCMGIWMGKVDAFAQGDNAELVSVSVQAGAQMTPGTLFAQTWTMQNTGTTTWSPGVSGYALYLVGKDSLGAVPLSTNTYSNGTLPTRRLTAAYRSLPERSPALP